MLFKSSQSGASYGDVRSSQEFDRLKDGLSIEEKSKFLELFLIKPETEILKCRKAELHIQLCSKEDTAKAYELLKGLESQLAKALMLQVYAAMGEPELVRQNLPEQLEPAQTLLDIEAHYHFMRWAAWLYWTEGKLGAAELAYLKAQGYAESLGLSYALKIIKRDLDELRGEQAKPDETGNPNLQHAYDCQNFKAMAPDNFKARLELPFHHMKLASSIRLRQNCKANAALGALHGVSFIDPEMKLYLAMQKLELSWRLSESQYTEPERNKTLADDLLKTLAYLPSILEFCGRYFPAAALKLGLTEYVAMLDEKGVSLKGEHYSLPKKAAQALIQDVYLGSNELANVDRVSRHRALAKLNDIGLEPSQLMTFLTRF